VTAEEENQAIEEVEEKEEERRQRHQGSMTESWNSICPSRTPREITNGIHETKSDFGRKVVTRCERITNECERPPEVQEMTRDDSDRRSSLKWRRYDQLPIIRKNGNAFETAYTIAIHLIRGLAMKAITKTRITVDSSVNQSEQASWPTARQWFIDMMANFATPTIIAIPGL
jgi:hypothetical protein